MIFDIPDYVKSIIDALERVGHEAYIVGGSIRDRLLGKEAKDYDIATDAHPQRIKDIFSQYKTIDIGSKFGTIIIHRPEGNVEITTFRKDGNYIDGRRPEQVYFSNSIEEDLSRRDFTINAMAYNGVKGLIDPYNGSEDLDRKIIKTVGDPEERFKEDYLRILRAVRFAAQLGFTIENSTVKSGREHCKGIEKISWERIAQEFHKIILCSRPSYGIGLLNDLGILEIILPEIIPSMGFEQHNPHHEMDVYDHTLCVLDNTPSIIQIRLAALFHDMGKPHTLTIDEEGIGHFYDHQKIGAYISKGVLERFKTSNILIKKVYNLVYEHMNHHADFKEKGLKRLIRRLGDMEVFNLMDLQIADIKCSNKGASIEHIVDRRNRIEQILKEEEAYKREQMAIDGRDLLDLGFEEGPIIGEILDYLLEEVMENPDINHKVILKDMALDFSKELRGK